MQIINTVAENDLERSHR